MKSIIQLENVDKTYKRKTLFSHFNLNVEENALLGITGKSGCGKSTLLFIMSALTKPDSGKVWINGKDYQNRLKHSEIQRLYQEHISFVFQNYLLDDSETVYSNLKVPLSALKVSKKEYASRMLQALAEVNLPQIDLKQHVCELSGGEQQRIALARAIMKPYQILFCDEPTSSLDSGNSEFVMNKLADLKNSGKTIVIASHDRQVLSFCDQIVKIEE